MNKTEELLKDLSARLPYNLYIRLEGFNVPKNDAITEGFIGNYLKDNRCSEYDTDDILDEFADGCIDIKPYLRSMSSMTEKERLELSMLSDNDSVKFYLQGKDVKLHFMSGDCFQFYKVFDWLNEHHFDYRGLIEKGFALEAPDGMY